MSFFDYLFHKNFEILETSKIDVFIFIIELYKNIIYFFTILTFENPNINTKSFKVIVLKIHLILRTHFQLDTNSVSQLELCGFVTKDLMWHVLFAQLNANNTRHISKICKRCNFKGKMIQLLWNTICSKKLDFENFIQFPMTKVTQNFSIFPNSPSVEIEKITFIKSCSLRAFQ
jgi:hypothetical protein